MVKTRILKQVKNDLSIEEFYKSALHTGIAK